ncbi:hypothetical protein [Pseudanabaena sp. PCC 6802]|uniref:hypothetical protein n=1 Tax=Pseudanabaena sp. PCC 6802 TaxID=118173 RepID=UPI000377AE9B|nr:hypothetical protein [Pseudanabaena sp. PCC 6802]
MKKLPSIAAALTLQGVLASIAIGVTSASVAIVTSAIAPYSLYAQPQPNSSKRSSPRSLQPSKPTVMSPSVALPKLPEGSLVRGDTPTPVYVINAGRRRLVPNPATFDALGYRWEKVTQIPEQQLKAIPELPPILLKSNPDFKDGTLVKDSSDRVYLISLGGRRLIPDAKTFESLGYKQEDVRQISDREMKSLPEYAPLSLNSLSFKDGTLLKGSLPAVYVISGNKRRLIPDEATFKALGYKWENVQTISDRALSAIPELPPLTGRIIFQDGTLLKGSSAAIYVISSGRRRLIPNARTFEALGYRWESVQQISDRQLESIPEMPPLPSF